MRKLITLSVVGCLLAVSAVAQNVKLLFTVQHKMAIPSAEFSPDGRTFLTASTDKTAKIWDATNGKMLLELIHSDGIWRAKYSPDGRFVITASQDKTAKVWDAKTGEEYYKLKGHKDDLMYALFSPDMKYIGTASSDKTAKLWDAKTGKLIVTLEGHKEGLAAIFFSRDSKHISTLSYDGVVKLWDVSGKFLWETEPGLSIRLTEFTPDNENILISTIKGLGIFDVATGELKGYATRPDEYSFVNTFSADGQYYLEKTANNSVRIYETSNSRLIWKIEGHKESVYGVDFSPNAHFFLTSSFDKTAKVWQLNDAPETSSPKPKAPASLEIASVAFAEQQGNGNNMLDAGEKGTISFTLSNSGKGKAFGLFADVKSINNISGLEYSRRTKLSDLDAGATTNITIPIAATQNVLTGKEEFEVVITEANGFNADPIRVSFNTRKFENPQLVIADHKFSTSNSGKIKPGQVISLKVILQNRGQGNASNIEVSFANPTNVFPGGESKFAVAKLEPNQSKIIDYEFFTNKLYVAPEISIDVVVSESYSKYGDKRTLKVSLEQDLSQTQTLNIAGQDKTPVQIDNVSLQPNITKQVQQASTEEANTISGKPAFYSLIIGVEEYQYASANFGNLNKPVTDASALRKILLSDYSFPETNSVFLKNPTRSDIITALENLAEKVTAIDNLLIFYAGHGYWDERLKVGYWLPSDSKSTDKSTWISNSTVRDYIAGIQSRHTLLITDACFGGSIFKTREVTSDLNEYGVAKIYRLPSRKAMTSGTLTTVPDESKFMQFLIKRLSENTNKYLTARQLFFSLETAVLNNTNTVPQLGVIQETGDEGGDFIFIKK